MRLVNHTLHFSRTMLRDILAYNYARHRRILEDKNFIKFHSKIVRFCHFFMKSNMSTHFFISLF